FFFFFSSRRRHTRFSRDWSSDVCSSDLAPERHFEWSSSQARGDPREILYAAPAPVLHDVEGAVGGGEKLFRRVTVFWESGNAGADRQSGSFGFRSQALANPRDDARRDVLAGFRKNQREFIAAVTRGRVDGARVAAKNFSDAHQRAAAGQVSVLIVDELQPVRVEEQHAEGALRAARAVQFGFQHADETAIIREARKGIADGHAAYW